MNPNPYQSPANESAAEAARSSIKTVFRLLGAVALWLLSATFVLVGIAGVLSPPAKRIFHEHTYSFFAVVICSFLLPAISFFLFGLASWRRSVRLAIWGAALFVPLLVLLAARLYFGRLG